MDPKHWVLESLELWVFSLGNVLAFAPFGALLPHSFPRALGTYSKSLAAFVAGITCLELLQMITLLGSLDTTDILMNTIGFSIGFAAQRLCHNAANWRAAALWCVLCGALTLAAVILAQPVNALLFAA